MKKKSSDLALGALVVCLAVAAGLWRVGAAHHLSHAARLFLVVSVLSLLGLGALAAGERFRSFASARQCAQSRTGRTEEGWAGARALRPLLVAKPTGDRLVLGRLGWRLVASEPLQSVLVVGPSQSGKTTSLAVPALLEWRGPVLATSVKGDLLKDTLSARRALGPAVVFDPTGSTGIEAAGWSPVSGAMSWRGARQVASALCSVGRRDGGIEEAGFWYAAAERLLAPLLRAAAGRSMESVVRWLDDETTEEPLLLLEALGEKEAARMARSIFSTDERQRSSVYATAQTVVAAYADPDVLASEHLSPRLESDWLFGGGARTLYCCAPAREQARLSPVFVALVRQVLDAGFERASKTGALDEPLLVVLDEAANVAPLDDLDQLVATSVGHGVSFMTIWQDLAQIEARYGARWATIVNNHRAKVVCPGVSDPRTLELLSSLIGDVESSDRSRSLSGDGAWSETDSPVRLPVAPAGFIRRLPKGHCLIVYGSLPPALVSLRPFFEGRRRFLS